MNSIYLSDYLSKEERIKIGNQIHDYRKSSGFTLHDVALLAQVNRKTVGEWETGRVLVGLVRALMLHRKTNGECGVKVTRPDFIKFLREFKDVIDDLKI